MAKPAIISVDDDAGVSAAIGRDLRDHYASDYRILPTTSGAQALELLATLVLRGQPVALIISDQKMPEMTGVQFLERAKEHSPGAKLVLLTGAWFGWIGVLFVLLLGSVLGTMTALAVYVTRGHLPEPEGVQEERRELLEELAKLEGEERAAFEAELARDPLFAAPEKGLSRARLAFGPFLAIATLTYALAGRELVGIYLRLGFS